MLLPPLLTAVVVLVLCHSDTHFSFKIDVTSIIRDHWNFITAHPNTWGHTISNYVNSGYIIKKLQVLSST
jgi:hypothetical protein